MYYIYNSLYLSDYLLGINFQKLHLRFSGYAHFELQFVLSECFHLQRIENPTEEIKNKELSMTHKKFGSWGIIGFNQQLNHVTKSKVSFLWLIWYFQCIDLVLKLVLPSHTMLPQFQASCNNTGMKNRLFLYTSFFITKKYFPECPSKFSFASRSQNQLDN